MRRRSPVSPPWSTLFQHTPTVQWCHHALNSQTSSKTITGVWLPWVWMGEFGWQPNVLFELEPTTHHLQQSHAHVPLEAVENQPTIACFLDAVGIPPLVNAHTHLELSLEETPIAIAPDQHMADWLLKVVALNQSASPEQRTHGLKQAVDALIACGTGTIGDIARTAEPWLYWLKASQQQTLPCVSGVGYLEVFHPADADASELSAWLKTIEQRVEQAKQTLQTMEATGSPSFKVGFSPHSPYNVSRTAWQALTQRWPTAAQHSHWAELPEERAYLQAFASPPVAFQQGPHRVHEALLGQSFLPNLFHPPCSHPSPLEAWLTSGVFPSAGTPFHLAHGLHLTHDESSYLASQGRSVVLCPRSNEWLHGRLPDKNALAPLLEANLLCFGTDSLLSCPTLNVWEEARLLKQAWNLSDETLLRMLTLNGHQTLGYSHSESGFQQASPLALLLLEKVTETRPPVV